MPQTDIPPEVKQYFEEDEIECIHVNVERFGEHRYRILGEIGKGGQATVHKAERLNAPNDTVALKVFNLNPQYWGMGEPSARTRFREEARIWHEFADNPYVVPLLDTFLDLVRDVHTFEWELYYGFVMPFSPDGDLLKFLQRNPNYLKRSKKDTLTFLLHIARAIKTGHDKNYFHADIKPQNILVFRDGGAPHPKVMDFGMAMPSNANAPHFGYGTPEYLAPEQFLPSSMPTKEADIYALGILYYEMISGQKAFPSHTFESVEERWHYFQKRHNEGLNETHKHAFEAAGGIGGWDLIKGMTSKSVDDRRQNSMANVIRRLEGLLEEERSRSVRDPESQALIRPRKYRWNPTVHEILGNRLHYFVFKGRQPLSDPNWIMNNLKDAGLHGYSLYRVLGGYDYLLRIWAKLSYLDRLEEVVTNFRDSQGGQFLRFKVEQAWILGNEANEITPNNEEQLLREIFLCADQNSEIETQNLMERHFTLGTLGRDSRYPLRFFLTIHTSEPIHPELGEAYAHKFRSRLQKQGFAQMISMYAGDGAFALLIKFCLERFELFREVINLIQATSRGLGNGSVFMSTQTFLEVDEHGYIESDDGSIIAEVNRVGAE